MILVFLMYYPNCGERAYLILLSVIVGLTPTTGPVLRNRAMMFNRAVVNPDAGVPLA